MENFGRPDIAIFPRENTRNNVHIDVIKNPRSRESASRTAT